MKIDINLIGRPQNQIKLQISAILSKSFFSIATPLIGSRLSRKTLLSFKFSSKIAVPVAPFLDRVKRICGIKSSFLPLLKYKKTLIIKGILQS